MTSPARGVIRWAKSRGVQVTAEVTPHHLLLTDACAESYDPVFKVNPPLRPSEDVEALRAALADGTIDVIGTDHAPHPRQDKECEWSGAAHGMTGLETALSIAQHTLVDTGLLMPHWPTPYGRDADAVTQVVIDEELARAGVEVTVLEKHADALRTAGFDANNGIGDLYSSIASLPDDQQAAIRADIGS